MITEDEILKVAREAAAESCDRDGFYHLRDAFRSGQNDDSVSMRYAILGARALAAHLAAGTEAAAQFRKGGCSDWYDGVPDVEDGAGPYETRTLYTAPPAKAEVKVKALEAALRELILAHVNLLEIGRDRIIAFGGQCSPVDVMEAGAPALRAARSALAEDAGAAEEQLGRFGHHPDAAIDFCVEIETIEGEWSNIKTGFMNGTPTRYELVERVARAMTFRVGGDEGAVNAKAVLRKIEAEMKATPAPASDDLVERDIYEVANQLASYVGPDTPPELAAFLVREGKQAAKLAATIASLRAEVEPLGMLAEGGFEPGQKAKALVGALETAQRDREAAEAERDALKAEVARKGAALRGLERVATEVKKMGAELGPQWLRLTAALVCARAALAPIPAKEG